MFLSGFGIGLRAAHYQSILTQDFPIDWFEILTENYLGVGGKARNILEQIRARYPLAMHGVSLSLGSTDPLDQAYLQQLKTLIQDLQPHCISDHLCWTGVQEKNTHDLLPLPYTEEALAHVVERIQRVQDYLGQQILIENVSSYICYQYSVITEWDFINEVCARADCYLLLDVNNVYVNAVNHHFNSLHYINAITLSRVRQIHLAGHTQQGDYLVDTHDQAIAPPVWDLYATAVMRFGRVATMIERDDNIPTLSCLIEELNQARQITGKIILE